MSYLKYKKGFTLIELLIVISIIGILSAIVLTILQGGRSAAKDAAYIAYVSQVTKLVEIAAADGAFDTVAHNDRGCLGNYNGDRCWRGAPGWENEPLSINGGLSGYGEIPDGQTPYNNDNFGTIVQRYDRGSYNIMIIYAYVGYDSSGRGRADEICPKFGWESIDYMPWRKNFCGTYIDLDR